MMFEIRDGLDIPISGEPVQDINHGPAIGSVALLGNDYHGMRPTMLVGEGDKVKLGQPLFDDKKTPGVTYTSPATGTVQSINRGEKRRFLSMVIDVADEETQFEAFKSFNNLEDVNRENAEEILLKSGLWSAFRTRPYSKVPVPGTDPHAIFVTAMDTHPLSGEPELIIKANSAAFIAGLTIMTRITKGKTFVCTRDDSRVPGDKIPDTVFARFNGPHPAGLVGTHINKLNPVGPSRMVWHIGYQDVIAIGHLFTTGQIMTERVVAVAGPMVNKPSLFKTRLGASMDDLVGGNVSGDNNRIISGSILGGRHAVAPENFLGRYHNQVSVLEEGNKREFLGWQKPGFDKFSITKIYGGSWLKKKFNMTTSSGGSARSMVPVGTYERVMPLDMLPTQLLRALIVNDSDEAQKLGCLELDEEDLSLCTYVCPGKYDFGSILRNNLTTIEKEG